MGERRKFPNHTQMKRLLLFPLLLFIIVGCFLACENDKTNEAANLHQALRSDIAELIVKYNLQYAKLPALMDYAFMGEGAISSNIKSKTVGKDEQHVIEIQYEGTKGDDAVTELRFEIGMPSNVLEKVTKATIAFLNHQMVIIDSETDQVYGFTVPIKDQPGEYLLKTDNNYEVKYIGIFKYDDATLKAQGCSCSCTSTWPVTAISCSCSSRCGNSCSITCYTGYQATCADDCPNQ